MGLEMRRKKIEKSDLDSFKENKWNSKQTSRADELKGIKDLLDSIQDEPLFTEQEAGKATIDTKLEDKEGAKLFEEMSNEEILKRIDNLFR